MSYQTVAPASDPRIVTELSPLVERLAAITPGHYQLRARVIVVPSNAARAFNRLAATLRFR